MNFHVNLNRYPEDVSPAIELEPTPGVSGTARQTVVSEDGRFIVTACDNNLFLIYDTDAAAAPAK